METGPKTTFALFFGNRGFPLLSLLRRGMKFSRDWSKWAITCSCWKSRLRATVPLRHARRPGVTRNF